MIGLCGAHRTGKTSLARAFTSTNVIPFVQTDVSGVFKALGFDPKEDYDFKVRMFIQNRILDATESIYKSGGAQFITDRTPLDMLAYTMADIQRANLDSDDIAMFEDYMERCFEVTNRFFATLIVVQPGIPLVEAEGKAPLNKAYIEHINTLVMGLIVDERMRATRHFIPRNMIDMRLRVNCVNNVLATVTGRFERVAAEQSFH